MFNLDDITNENNKGHNKKWLHMPEHPYRMLIIGGSGSRKANALLNLIKEQDSDSLIDKIYLYAKDLNESKYHEDLITKREDVRIKHFNDSKAFIECSNNMDDVYNNTDDYNPTTTTNLIVLDDIFAYIMTNNKIHATIKELFIRCRKLNISLVLITQYYFSVPKGVRLNSTHYLTMKIHNERELQNIAADHSADIDYKDFLKIYVKSASEPYSFLTIDTTLPTDNHFKI